MMESGASLARQGNSSGDGQQAEPTSIILPSLSPVANASDVPAGESLAADASHPSTICADPPVGTTNVNTDGLESVGLVRGKLKLPELKRLSSKLSDRQMEMREKAADVALRFSNARACERPSSIGRSSSSWSPRWCRESRFEPRAASPVGTRCPGAAHAVDRVGAAGKPLRRIGKKRGTRLLLGLHRLCRALRLHPR